MAVTEQLATGKLNLSLGPQGLANGLKKTFARDANPPNEYLFCHLLLSSHSTAFHRGEEGFYLFSSFNLGENVLTEIKANGWKSPVAVKAEMQLVKNMEASS